MMYDRCYAPFHEVPLWTSCIGVVRCIAEEAPPFPPPGVGHFRWRRLCWSRVTRNPKMAVHIYLDTNKKGPKKLKKTVQIYRIVSLR